MTGILLPNPVFHIAEFDRDISAIEDQMPELLYYCCRNVLQKRWPL